MKEKLSSVVERLEIIGELLLVPFVIAGILSAFVGEGIGGFFKRNAKKMIIVGIVFCLLAGYAASGVVVVGPQTVKVVRYPDRIESTSLILFEKPMPLVNDTDHIKIYYAWPRIPWTDIGVREESYSLNEPLELTDKIELFSVYDLTRDPADKGKVAYLVVSGTFEVTDWETFLLEFDPKMVKEEFQTKTRSELLAYNTAIYLFGGNIDNWYAESISRTYLAQKFAKEYNLKTEEEIEYFIKVYRSWYWALGAMYFYQFEEEIMRNPFPNPYIYELAAECVTAANIENAIDFTNQEIEILKNQKEAFCEEFDPAVVERAESIVAEFKDYLKAKGIGWPVYAPKTELSDFLVKNQMKGAKYSPQELYAARTLVEIEAKIDAFQENVEYYNQWASSLQEYFKSLWLWQSKGNDSLWRFAIQRAANGEGLPQTGDFYPWLKTDGMEYLAEVAEFYQELGLFDSMGVKFQNITFTIEEVIEAPGK